MTTVVENAVPGPATHALIVAVGYYHHLPGGEGRTAQDTMGLSQLTTPPLSAKAVIDWLVNDYKNPAAPLGSIELLVSEPGGFTYGTRPVDGATLNNVLAARDCWLPRLNGNADNVAFFYFCGHGVERDTQYLLLEDFGASEADPMAASIDLDRFHDGMTACRADTQIFVADACRQVPWDLIPTYGDMGTALVRRKLGGNTDRTAPILRAAAQGQSAFGAPGEVTRFTQALLAALRGAGAVEEPDSSDHWVVRYFALAGAVGALLANAPEGTPRQESRTGGEAGDVLLAELAGPPQVSVQVDCVPPETATYVNIELSSAIRNVTRSSQPIDGLWHAEVPADYAYRLAATYTGDRYPPLCRTVPVLPPMRRFPVQVTP
jgi:Caspase domain